MEKGGKQIPLSVSEDCRFMLGSIRAWTGCEVSYRSLKCSNKSSSTYLKFISDSTLPSSFSISSVRPHKRITRTQQKLYSRGGTHWSSTWGSACRNQKPSLNNFSLVLLFYSPVPSHILIHGLFGGCCADLSCWLTDHTTDIWSEFCFN